MKHTPNMSEFVHTAGKIKLVLSRTEHSEWYEVIEESENEDDDCTVLMEFPVHITERKFIPKVDANAERTVALWNSMEGLSIYEIKRLRSDFYQATEIINNYMKEVNELIESRYELLDNLKEAKIQLEYLDNKFTPTGTTAVVLLRLQTAINNAEQSI